MHVYIHTVLLSNSFVVASGCAPLVIYIQSFYTISMHAKIYRSNNDTIINTEPLLFLSNVPTYDLMITTVL